MNVGIGSGGGGGYGPGLEDVVLLRESDVQAIRDRVSALSTEIAHKQNELNQLLKKLQAVKTITSLTTPQATRI